MNNQHEHSGERVMVAMSGGVDSSVTAALLVERGYIVEGGTMKLFDSAANNQTPAIACGPSENIQDAQNVAARLNIPYHVFNCTAEFSARVIDSFCASYLSGQTPNPCIECNRYLKFAALQERRRELGCDYVATGHYALREYDEDSGRYVLKRARDKSKDQSYVLYHLTQDTLAHMLFPLGESTKTEVRALAHKLGLENAEKPESQDICFIPDGNYISFVEQHTGAPLVPGSIVDENGTKLGTHLGLARYTIGQRKGLGIAAAEPLYVVRKDATTNTVVVGPAASLEVRCLRARDVNFISGEAPTAPIHVQAKISYRGACFPAQIQMEGEDVLVQFDNPVRAVAPGQAVVFYQDDTVLGGATISSIS